MRIILCENYEEVSEKAAKLIASQVFLKPDSVIGLTAGETPVGMYDRLIDMNKNGEVDFSNVTTFNLDEYYPMKKDDSLSYHSFMDEHLFSKINISKENTHMLDGETDSPEIECKAFEGLISQKGGIDLQVLGIGRTGHIGFNAPEVNLSSCTHLTELAKYAVKSRAKAFGSEENVPKQAMTMGISTILKAKKIILLASGASKSRAISELLNEEINTAVPATLLKTHPDVVIICDKDAYTGSKLGIDIGGTSIKFAVVKGEEMIYKSSIDTEKISCDKLIDDIVEECDRIKEKYSVKTVGVGTPGLIQNGLISAVNLPFSKTPLENLLSERLDLPVTVDNDANCAAMGEAEFGAGKDYSNVIMVTLGTGVGGGVIMNKQICHGNNGTGEIGHMIVQTENGRKCPCGQTGCWEQYASVTALVRESEKAANENTDSILYKLYSENNNKLNGKLVFEALDKGCEIAEKVFSEYIDWLAVGITNLINIFGPDIIILAGGITAKGDLIIGKLKERINSNIPIEISPLQNDAGSMGAAML